MMITDGDSAGHDDDEYDTNHHHNFVWLKWFLPYLDRTFYCFLRPGEGACICFLDYIQVHCNGGMISSYYNFYIFDLTSWTPLPKLDITVCERGANLIFLALPRIGNFAWFLHWKTAPKFSRKICIGNSMICSDIWHKYHRWYFEIVIRNSGT